MLIEVNQEADENGNVFILREDLEIRWNGYHGCIHVKFTISAGFKSDGASVPRFFWRAVFPPGDNRAMRAAFAHDYIYRMHLPGWSKAEADRMFYDLLIEGGISWYRAGLAWLGVYLFGWNAWKAGEK